MIAPAASQAATITVTTTADEHLDPGPDTGCSLREAITAANTTGSFGGCTATDAIGDTIVLANNTTYTRTLTGAAEDGNVSGDFDVLNEPLTIQVSSPGNAPATIQGTGNANIDRTFDLFASAGFLIMSGVRITQGEVDPGTGGGIFVASGATLSLTDSTVDNNTAASGGGGILNAGSINLKNVTISSNDTDLDGGGISNQGSGLATLNNVTVASNTADFDTDDNGEGGGLFDNSTQDINIRNTIVGSNQDLSPTPALRAHDCSGSPFSNGWNLIGSTTNCGYSAAGTDIINQSPQLNALGASDSHQVHVPLSTSPAVDAGNNTATVGTGGSSCETADQRNRARSGALTGFGGAPRCDIGAVELQKITASPSITDTDPDSPNSTSTMPLVKGGSGTTDSSISNVSIYTQSNCGGSPVISGARATFIGAGLAVTVPANDTTTLSARGFSSDGAPGPCGNDFAYTHDSMGPVAPTITDTNPDTPSSIQTPAVKGTASADTTTIRVYAQAGCTGMFTSGDKTDFEGMGITAPSVTANSSNSLSARPFDAVGNSGTCSSSFTYVHDNIAPAAPAIGGTNPPSGSNNNSPFVIGMAESGSTVQIFRQGECPGGTALVSGPQAEFGSPGLPISVGDNTTTQLVAQATDAAGNAGPCGTVPFAYQEITPATMSPGVTVPPKKKCKKGRKLKKGKCVKKKKKK